MKDRFVKSAVTKYWIAKTEVTWDEYLAFFRATGSQGRTEGQVVTIRKTDAISGATPPWGAPDQGWGKGSRPAITMSWYAANVYCQLVIESYRQKVPASYRSRMGICLQGRNTNSIFL